MRQVWRQAEEPERLPLAGSRLSPATLGDHMRAHVFEEAESRVRTISSTWSSARPQLVCLSNYPPCKEMANWSTLILGLF